MCQGGGLKTETGKFLLHFQNSKSSNRCHSVYGTDIKIITLNTNTKEIVTLHICYGQIRQNHLILRTYVHIHTKDDVSMAICSELSFDRKLNKSTKMSVI